MAKEKKTLKKFEAVALPKEKAQQIKGGYRDLSAFPRTDPAPSFVGWGEVEIRKPVSVFAGLTSGPPAPGSGR
ncbi:MAG: hypothetical protein IPJ40_00805 [Saprospirales bacterium]|nr:hypothetical protein [Saprospirales bacterium]